MQEEIIFQGENIKTKLKFFTTFSGQTSEDDKKYYLITDSNNQPLKLVDNLFETNFGLNSDNYNISLSALSGGYIIYTGSVITNEFFNILDNAQKQFITDDYITRINSQANVNSSNPSTNPFSYVFFEDYNYNDYYLNVKLNRSLDILNTLNVYNVPTNESIKFNNNTGILYGKILALQILLDDNGNKIKIPIKNASVGIFNSSDEFPSVGSVDDEGNRIRMNLYEGFETINDVNNLKSYGSFQSYLTDLSYSTKDYQNDQIPEKFKYTTITNEEGEFILHNVPSGNQTLMIEVDLLKQGLEPEEVALNFFPYPLSESANISNVPHLYFNQFPITIVPSWGEFQTGYTEINLTISLDLRKWITYFTYPISSKVANSAQNITNQAGDVKPRVLEELYRDGILNPFTVLIRDMTKNFSVENPARIESVQILDIYDKNLDLKCAWNEEIKVKRNKFEFNTTNYNAFKVPANLYDPNGIDTNGNKGVWLGAYQIKTFFPDPKSSFQTTGWALEWMPNASGGADPITANHYDLNWYDGWNNANVSPLPGDGIGIFPYEKPWSITYPEPYKITKKPEVKNPLKQWVEGTPLLDPKIENQQGVTNQFILTQGDFFLQPRYLDGDLVGGPDPWGTNANGFGLQFFGTVPFGNNFSREVSKNELWRYEKTDHWANCWSNGYNEFLTPSDFNKYPDAPEGRPRIDGEKFQRLEAGYAYWLKPSGWPRIKNDHWGDYLLNNDFQPLANHDYGSVYSSPLQYISYFVNTYLYLDEITLQVGPSADFQSKFGRLNIYRIEKPYYTNPKKTPFIEKFANFHFGLIYRDEGKDHGTQCKSRKTCDSGGSGDQATCFAWFNSYDPNWNTRNTGSGYEKYCENRFGPGGGVQSFPNGVDIRIHNIGSTKISILQAIGENKELAPSGSFGNYLSVKIFDNSVLTLPANDEYDPNTNSYNSASYIIEYPELTTYWDKGCNGPLIQPIYRYKVGIRNQITQYFLNSMIGREVGLGGSKCRAVKDYNNPSGISVEDFLTGTILVAFGIYSIFVPPLGAFFLDPRVRNLYFDSVRKSFSENPSNYNSGYRIANRIGVFVNGVAYVYDCFRYKESWLNSRGYLPYIGEEVKKSAEQLNINDVPYFGNSFVQRYHYNISRGAGVAIFQPKRMYENDLKGARYHHYFCEWIYGSERLDYRTAFV